MYRLYSKGLRQQPCGALVFRGAVDEYLFPTQQEWHNKSGEWEVMGGPEKVDKDKRVK